ncbi:MAG: hypothetical protein KDB20_01980, partial [Microthrixaceae bacterium]|nr:hypothetical protein [Microthrixaceae bacterium]
ANFGERHHAQRARFTAAVRDTRSDASASVVASKPMTTRPSLPVDAGQCRGAKTHHESAR